MPILKVTTVVGTRPEVIRLSRVLSSLDRHTNHRLVHTGQNYDHSLNQIFFDDLGLRQPDVYLNVAADSPGRTIANVIAGVDDVLEADRPDALLILGDTNSCLAAIPAKRRKIPIFHMEAGNRCFDQRVPEETNRKIVDHIADINLPYSDIARSYLLREGFPPDRVITTGSPMKEVLTFHRDRIEASQVLRTLGLEEGRYFVVSAHREENVDSPVRIRKLAQILNWLADTYGHPVIVSTHPRTRKRFQAQQLTLHPAVRLEEPMGFTDYIHLQLRSRATLSDSGTITEESSILGFRALNLREAHERPEGMEQAAVMMVGLNRDRITDGLAILADEAESSPAGRRVRVGNYDVDNVSEKVTRIILSYVDYVRRTVWQESMVTD